jgi:hypothetical protein
VPTSMYRISVPTPSVSITSRNFAVWYHGSRRLPQPDHRWAGHVARMPMSRAAAATHRLGGAPVVSS